MKKVKFIKYKFNEFDNIILIYNCFYINFFNLFLGIIFFIK